jgi:hypothetical protein
MNKKEIDRWLEKSDSKINNEDFFGALGSLLAAAVLIAAAFVPVYIAAHFIINYR